jgi:type I restriction enzyme S subunit
LRNQNVQWDRIDLSELSEMTFDDEERQKFALRPGDLLVCEGGEPGRAAVWRGELSDCFFQKALHRVRPKPGFDSEFLMFSLWHLSNRGAFADLNSKTTIAHLPLIRLKTVDIPVIDHTEQVTLAKRLRSQLECTGAAASAAGIQLELTDEMLWRKLLSEYFEGCFPISAGLAANRSIHGWTWYPLNKMARLESGHTPSRRRPEWWGGDVPWLALTDIRKLHGKHAYETAEKTNSAGLANSAARLLPAGTVCLSRTASVGFVTILGKSMATSQDFCNWICGPELDPEFLMYAFMASQDYLRELGSGAVHKTIYMPTIEQFHVCAPMIDEQRHIARVLRERLDAAEALNDGLKARLAEIEQLPSRLLAAAFGSAG